MSNHNNPVPLWLTEEYMATILRKPLNAKDITVNGMEIKPASTAGDNFFCQVLRIKLNIKVDGHFQDIAIIGKITPETQLMDSMSEILSVFDTEGYFFESTLPKLRKHTKHDFAPECYHVDFDRKSIFMEDLKQSNYELQPRGKFLEFEHCKLVIEALAAFHGASYYAIQEDPTLSNKYLKTMFDGTLNDMNRNFFQNCQVALEKNMSKYGLSEEYEKKLKGFMQRLNDGGLQMMKRREDSLNFLLHGDDWMNNMMFCYKDGRPKSVKLLDFQIVYYSCFANDLHYFLFSSASADVLLHDLDLLLELYYNKLKEIASDIPNLTLERVKSEFAERNYFGYLIMVSFRPIIVSEVPPDMDKVLSTGGLEEMGFGHPRYISDLKLLLPKFDAAGVF